MRDPRLAEIDFLMDLERSDSLDVRAQLGNAESGAAVAAGRERRLYGLDEVRFRDMVLGLLLQRHIVGNSARASNERDEQSLLGERDTLIRHLIGGRAITVHISHVGRVHLWDRRDALLRDPDLEPFGLRSRGAWERDLFVRTRWVSPESPLSIMFIDLDNFGQVNKRHGAPVGDAVLRLVFGLVKNVIGTRGAAYRHGGEEISVLLPDVAVDKARELAESLRATIEKDVHTQVTQLEAPQTASIGVTQFTAPAENDAVVARVDELMRAAKQAGKNRVVSA